MGEELARERTEDQRGNGSRIRSFDELGEMVMAYVDAKLYAHDYTMTERMVAFLLGCVTFAAGCYLFAKVFGIDLIEKFRELVGDATRNVSAN